jgi:transitional endoplasmic reticulum ATPase
MTVRLPLTVVTADGEGLADWTSCPLDARLREVAASGPYHFTEPLRDDWLDQPLRAFVTTRLTADQLDPATPLYTAKGHRLHARDLGAPEPPAGREATETGTVAERPDQLSESAATQSAYYMEVDRAASLLRAGLSVLVVCDKICVQHLAEHIVKKADRDAVIADDRPDDQPEPVAPDLQDLGARPGAAAPAQRQSLRARLLAAVEKAFYELTDKQVLVIKHLDLLAGGSESTLSNEARDLTEQLYEQSGRTLLGFSDPSLVLPEVLASRFAVRIRLEGTSRVVRHPIEGTPQPLERSLVLQREAARFRGFDKEDFYKFVAGLNPVVLREAMRYAYQETQGRDDVTVADLKEYIRTFKAQTSSNFEVPTHVTFDQIGGYDDVKKEIGRALRIIADTRELPEGDEQLSGELVPHGFIFHGDPGTGKTLFAKAIANQMVATIQVISGPEVTNKYVGESERHIRELFAEARRNAPSVIVFDEFDAIAASRSSWDDGGSRAGNAMVAQILTEMDGFRPDVQMLVIGTTNRLEIIDKALLRPSRFSTFHIPLPDPEARREIIKVHARRYRVDVTGLMEQLVEATSQWNGDEIRALFSEAYTGRQWEKIPADAERLGELVGRVQRNREKQQESTRGRL